MRPPICGLCEERPATKEHTRAGQTERLCDVCYDEWVTHDALDSQLPQIWDLKRRGQYDEALACLASILEANRFPDYKKWLSQSIASERASILSEAGRYSEAEQAYKEWAELGFQDLWRRQLYAIGLADTLGAMGRDGEAISVLESVLGQEEADDLSLAMVVLTRLAQVSDKAARPVDPKWRKVAEAVAEHFSIEMPSASSFEAAILALDKAVDSRRREARRPTVSDP